MAEVRLLVQEHKVSVAKPKPIVIPDSLQDQLGSNVRYAQSTFQN